MPTSQVELRPPFAIGDTEVQSGTRAEIVLALPRLPAGPEAHLPLIVLHGARQGPTVWLSAAIHGDELNGIEIIRRVLRTLDPAELNGTVIAAPVVNVFGVTNGSRTLPDNRDLNRSFPGTRKGSLASRLAHTFMNEVVSRCILGIDLHTGSDHRYNLPQTRADLSDPETRRLALAFGAPVTFSAKPRPGSLRSAAAKHHGARVLLFEGGVSLRYDESIIEMGVLGVRRVLSAIGLLDPGADETAPRSFIPSKTRWLRASRGGFVRVLTTPGDQVDKGDVLAEIHDSLGKLRRRVRAPDAGIVIGQRLNPMAYQGDAVIHLAPLEGGAWSDA